MHTLANVDTLNTIVFRGWSHPYVNIYFSSSRPRVFY